MKYQLGNLFCDPTIPLHMGTDRSQIREQKDTETQNPLTSFFIGAVIVLVAIAICSKLSLSGEGETPKLNPKDQAKLEKRFKELDDSEQYALVASVDGFYTCVHSGWSTYYLKAGEVWKYGVTSKGVFGRYTASFLFKNKVIYIAQFKGNIAECLKMEQVKLFNYPYSAENLARPPEKRLPRPPYNSIMR